MANLDPRVSAENPDQLDPRDHQDLPGLQDSGATGVRLDPRVPRARPDPLDPEARLEPQDGTVTPDSEEPRVNPDPR